MAGLGFDWDQLSLNEGSDQSIKWGGGKWGYNNSCNKGQEGPNARTSSRPARCKSHQTSDLPPETRGPSGPGMHSHRLHLTPHTAVCTHGCNYTPPLILGHAGGRAGRRQAEGQAGGRGHTPPLGCGNESTSQGHPDMTSLNRCLKRPWSQCHAGESAQRGMPSTYLTPWIYCTPLI